MVGGGEGIRTLETWWVGCQAGSEAGVIEGILSVGGAGVRGLTFGGWGLGLHAAGAPGRSGLMGLCFLRFGNGSLLKVATTRLLPAVLEAAV